MHKGMSLVFLLWSTVSLDIGHQHNLLNVVITVIGHK